MKLGFHYHLPGHIIDDVIWVPGVLGVFLDGLANEVDELVLFLHSPLPNEVKSLDYPIKGKNINMVEIGLHYSMPKRLLLEKKIIGVVANKLLDLDIILLRAPSPLSPYFVKFLNGKIKTAILLVGNYSTIVDDPSLPFWKNKLIRLFLLFIHYQQNKAVKKSLLFVNSPLLIEENKAFNSNPILVKTTTLTLDSFFEKPEGNFNVEEIRILYTGRIDLSKGLLFIVHAISTLSKQGLNIEFHLVGGENFGSNSVQEEIIQYATNLGIAELIIFHGFKKVGEELNQMYRKADIFINASIGSEGFPRTIWEAMANSLPVIATQVGGIPFFLKDKENAMLIEPENSSEIVESIKLLINNSKLRDKITKRGFQLAKQNTIEIQSKILKQKLMEYAISSNF
jgi:glycosyltransferase involved in cell wall biosynthesis